MHLQRANEIKLVFPQHGLDPTNLLNLDFHHFWLQPMDGEAQEANIAAAAAYCLANPRWRLSLQNHKITGLP